MPLGEVLTEHSTYARKDLKKRLFDEGIKQRKCEQCGQNEIWRGKRISLILDHINGIRDDNRLSNLQIVCPNCAAALETHCGRGSRRVVETSKCEHCRSAYEIRFAGQRFCSRKCAIRARAQSSRRAVRPPLKQLEAEVTSLGYCGTGRKYGVSDNAIRKWLRTYDREVALVSPEAP